MIYTNTYLHPICTDLSWYKEHADMMCVMGVNMGCGAFEPGERLEEFGIWYEIWTILRYIFGY